MSVLYILMILNLTAIFFSYVCWISIDRAMRLYFALFFAIPMVIGIGLFAITEGQSWTIMAWVGFLFRGWLIFSVLSGAFACYLKTKFSNKK